jgi:hypothetical protein
LVALITASFYSEANYTDLGCSSLKLINLLLFATLATSAIDAVADDDAIAIENASEPSLTMPNEPCPAAFFQLPLHPQARLCQVFADQLPASLTYHADTDQQSAIAFYQQQLGQAESESNLKGRIVLQYKSTAQTIIISEDGSGSQIDILVKASD